MNKENEYFDWWFPFALGMLVFFLLVLLGMLIAWILG